MQKVFIESRLRAHLRVVDPLKAFTKPWYLSIFSIYDFYHKSISLNSLGKREIKLLLLSLIIKMSRF